MRVLYVFLQAIVGLAIIAAAWIAASVVVQDVNKLPALGTVVNRAIELATSDDYRAAHRRQRVCSGARSVAGNRRRHPAGLHRRRLARISMAAWSAVHRPRRRSLDRTDAAVVAVVRARHQPDRHRRLRSSRWFPVANAVMMSLASRQNQGRACDRARPALGRSVRRQCAGDLRNAGGPRRRRDLHHDRGRAIQLPSASPPASCWCSCR